MMQIWQQIRLGKHVGFEEGESGVVRRGGGVRATLFLGCSELRSEPLVRGRSEPDRAVFGVLGRVSVRAI